MLVIAAKTPVILMSYDVDPATEHVGVTRLRLEYREAYLGILRRDFEDAPGGLVEVVGAMGGAVASHEVPRRIVGPKGSPLGASLTLVRPGANLRTATRWYLIRDDAPPPHDVMAPWPIPLRLVREAAERVALALNTMY
jgi:hypothetical protein